VYDSNAKMFEASESLLGLRSAPLDSGKWISKTGCAH
jgi:hypothetical protein